MAGRISPPSHLAQVSEVDGPPTLTRRLANRPFSVRERASRPSCLRVQVRRFWSQAVFTKGRFTRRRLILRRK
eukprot:1608090-Pyramimonas_sp.AAC.1